MRLWLVILGLLPILLVGSGPGAVASTPALPPHNGLIAVNGWDGIYIVDPQAGTTRLVPKTLEMSESAWSPDGTTLAVSMPYGESSAVYTMKPDGSERKLVLAHAYSPSWSPDGKQLVVVQEGKADATELAIVGADGGDVRTLDLGAREDFVHVAAPEWSPDGKLIAFVDVGEGVIALVSPDGDAAAKPVVQADATGISWSPDSTRLAFDHYAETKDGGRSVVVVLDVATGKQGVFAGEQHGARSPMWSPEGDQIAFLSTSKRSTSTTTSTTTSSHSCGGEDVVSQLWVMSPQGTKAHMLVEGEYYGPPSWARALAPLAAPPADREPTKPPLPAPPGDTAPEPLPAPDTAKQKPTPAPAADEAAAPEAPKPVPAKRLASSASTDGLIAVRGSVALYLADPATGDTRKIPDTSDMVAPAWSPDAELLAVERVGKGTSSIWTIRPDGTDPRLVLPNASLPSWSPAGDLIYAVRNECATPCEPEDEAANVLFSVRPDGTDVQRVDPEDLEAADGRDFRWAPDGDAIGFFADELESNPGTFDSSEAAWSPDEMNIAFVGALGPFDEDTAEAPPPYGLWIVSADGGTPQLLLEGASGRPSWAPR